MMDTSPRFQRLYARTLDGMITPSREVKRTVEGYAWMRGVQVQNIPNGIDLAELDARRAAIGGKDGARHRLGISADTFVIGAIGRLEAHKGIHYLIDAFARLEGKAADLLLLIVGDGSLGSELEARAKRIGLDGGRVRFAGYQPEILPYLLALDVLVLPSTTPYETFGQALIEAMACYIPVVGSDVGGVPEVVTHDRNGWLVPAADAKALRGALERLRGDPAACRRLARAGRRTVEEHYREETMLDRLESYLEGVVRRA